MRGSWGQSFRITIFGESHGEAIGVVVDGLPAGLEIDFERIAAQMRRRAPGRSDLSTPRREGDVPRIVSGVFQGRTTGTPLCAFIENTDTRPGDYEGLRDTPRPGHADYTGFVRYSGYNDPRGGGHFSGRLTAPLVFCGALAAQLLRKRGIYIGAHIKSVYDAQDIAFDESSLSPGRFEALAAMELPVLDEQIAPVMRERIQSAAKLGDSVGGVIQCAAIGAPAGLGEPFFGSVESTLCALLFSIPGVKGVSFGLGFESSKRLGSQVNDAYYMDEGRVRTRTNHCGGALGGITTGMPIVFDAAFRPTASISKPQETISLQTGEKRELRVKGRHDPCIVPRAVPVIEAAVAIGLAELLLQSGCREL